MQYYTTQYTSRAQHLIGEVAPLFIFGAGMLYLLYRNYKNSIDINALDFHSHTAHGTIPVNSDGEFLYLNGAWF